MSRRGRIIQMTCIIALLFSLGVSTCVLIAAGYGSFSRMSEFQDECLNTRVAMNYVSMHIRRFDAENSVRIDEYPMGTCLVLSEDIEGEKYETRIYLYNGYLRESFVSAESPFNEEYGFEIIQLDSFAIERENNVIEIELANGASRRNMTLTLMSA